MAEKIILKRSSILGKRPTNDNIQAGELALNTNSEDPGAFFEVSDGNIIKIGPTAVSPFPPIEFPEKGENWLNLSNGTLNIGTVEEARKVWRQIASPFLGGAGNCVFVAPEFKFSNDELTNDGQSLPFRTVNRAILELSKIYISRVLAGFSKQSESNRYTVFLAPSNIAINNGVGASLEDFNVDFSTDPYKEVTIPDLVQFNTEDGGVIVPFGVSIQGMDLKKSLLFPSYVPSYRNPLFPPEIQGVNQPVTSILKCSGNSYLVNFSVTDKNNYVEITSVTQRDSFALFRSRSPHGLEYNDKVSLSFSPLVDQTTGTLTPGDYYAIPLDTFSFYLSPGSQEAETAEAYVSLTEVPILTGVTGPKFFLSVELKSAHRLRLVNNVSFSDLGNYYTKVQRAFSSFFGGRVTEGSEIVSSGDYIIVGSTSSPYPSNEAANTVRNSSLYANQVNLRSEYGMCWGDFDGSIVEGFKSVIANSCTAVSLQNDPQVYEIYTTLTDEEGVTEQRWWGLTEAKYLSTPLAQRPSSLAGVSRNAQLALLNSTPINNIRYYYQSLTELNSNKSIGILDVENDFRHFGFRTRNGAYAQLQSIYTIGPAVGVWSLNGGICNLTNSTSNFGSISFKSEGFLGINTVSGANDNNKGFVIEGIQRPLMLTQSQAESFDNKKILSLGGRIISVSLDSEDPLTQIISLNADFSPGYLLPYSLKPGSALWVDSGDCTYRGFFQTDGGPTVITGLDDPNQFAKLRIRALDSTIPNDPNATSLLGIPYIRRFKDPRPDFDRSYSLYLRNTTPTSIPPQIGYVLRLNQESQQLGSNSLKPNVQFDPGNTGGWGRIFTVDAVETGSLGSSPQFNYAIADTNQDLTYYVAITASDYSRPWRQGLDFRATAGTYTTFRYRNWYTAESNLWGYLYYGDVNNYDDSFGPYSVSPVQPYSPFVDTSVLERQESVNVSYQGTYASDPLIGDYLEGSSYLRGSTYPYPTYSSADVYDDDDSSEDMGLCLKDSTSSNFDTYTVGTCEIIQTEQMAEFATETQPAKRYRPAILEFSVLSPVSIPNPRQRVSVVKIVNGSFYEYIRVIRVNGTTIRGIRLTYDNSFYSSSLPSGEDPSEYLWPALSLIYVCYANPTPSSNLYDPEWTNTKSAILRFFEVMGYSNSVVSPLLEPKYWGERLLPVMSLQNIPPVNGYAVITDKWPLEFNQPSTIIANTHTWAYTGYYNYSRGLIKYQTTDITKKLASDFQAYTLWSGRLTVTGINDKGEIVQFGPQRQALTANYYDFTSPINNPANKQIYEEQPFVEFPSQIIVYSADDISSQFNSSTSTFDLTRSGWPIPSSQLLSESMFVVVGGVVQKPVRDYTVQGYKITFTSPEQLVVGLTCSIRVITSADGGQTLVAVPFDLQEDPDGIRTVYTAKTNSVDATYLDVTTDNTFVILGGVEQIPFTGIPSITSPWSYTLERISIDTIQITFNEPPPAGIDKTAVDIRSFCSGSYWAAQSVDPVAVYTLDPISDNFNGSTTVFNLTYGGLAVNPSTVTEESLIISLGGSIQTPGSGTTGSYSLAYNSGQTQLIFNSESDAPLAGTTINMRVIAGAEFLSCPSSGRGAANFIEWGPGLVNDLSIKISELQNEIDSLTQQG